MVDEGMVTVGWREDERYKFGPKRQKYTFAIGKFTIWLRAKIKE
jgi:hypothetical protein